MMLKMLSDLNTFKYYLDFVPEYYPLLNIVHGMGTKASGKIM